MKRKDYHFDEATLREGHRLSVWENRPVGVVSNDAGVYRCLCCGARWQREHIWAWWPVSLRWSRVWAFGRHGVEVGCDGIERRIVAQVWSFGPLRVCLGLREVIRG